MYTANVRGSVLLSQKIVIHARTALFRTVFRGYYAALHSSSLTQSFSAPLLVALPRILPFSACKRHPRSLSLGLRPKREDGKHCGGCAYARKITYYDVHMDADGNLVSGPQIFPLQAKEGICGSETKGNHSISLPLQLLLSCQTGALS